MRMLVVGGDKRSGYLARQAEERGWQAQGAWLDAFDPAYACAWPQDLVFDVFVLPYPHCERDGMIQTPLATRPLPARDVAARVPAGALVITGSLGDVLQGVAQARGWRVHNPGWEEGFAVGNAVPSAEGAISVAMASSDTCIHDSCCLVLGYGRLGRVLARMLRGLGARACVAARKPKDRAWARAEGHDACDMAALAPRMAQTRFIFNTVPAPVLDEGLLALLGREAVIIDLSSAPHGVDFEAAARLGVRAWIEASLPGRYAPQYAGCVLLDVVEEIVADEAQAKPPALFLP
ncbi:MAG: hypothetical protein LBU67_08405 [Oscillospiraceae bacterium]|jgi:dipicolinate synthase subunit A|nr:hypothetical protein [Oscillospiraceae bacterium]